MGRGTRSRALAPPAVTSPQDQAHVAGPIRTCIGCRRRGSRSALVRVVLATTAGFARALVDENRSAPGRGAWLQPSRECLDLALRRRALGRALRSAAPVDADAVAEWFDQQDHHRGTSPRVVHDDMGSGLEADGRPMSTQR